jgi:hypothetical protein
MRLRRCLAPPPLIIQTIRARGDASNSGRSVISLDTISQTLPQTEPRDDMEALTEISEIREKAQQEKEEAVKQEGLNVQEFNAISRAVDQDSSLRDQVIEIIQEQ